MIETLLLCITYVNYKYIVLAGIMAILTRNENFILTKREFLYVDNSRRVQKIKNRLWITLSAADFYFTQFFLGLSA